MRPQDADIGLEPEVNAIVNEWLDKEYEEMHGADWRNVLDREELETAMYANACGLITSTELKQSFDKLGWKVDLRKWIDNTLEAIAPNGNVYILEC